MWEEEIVRPAPNRRVLLAAGIGLLLLLVAGCIFLFPFGFASQPALSFSKRQPSIVASKMYMNPGKMLALSGDSLGFWRVWQHNDSVAVNRFGPLGEAEWVADYSINSPLVDINGRQLILADAETGQVFTIEQGKGVTNALTLDGKIEAVAIAETGQWLVIHRPANGAPEYLESELAFHSRDGSLLFQIPLTNALPITAKMNQNGTQFFLLISKVSADGLENHLLSYADTGQVIWTAQLPDGPPIGLTIKPFADRIAVAIGNSVICYSGAGQPLWQHVGQGMVQDMIFLGQGDQVAYASQKVSVFSYKKQSLITVLTGQGQVAWQYEVKGSVPRLASGPTTLSAIIANDAGVHCIGSDGQVRWSQKHPYNEKKVEDFAAHIAYSGSNTVLVQLTDGRMLVLRGE
ncbi:MAG: PQQ-binding-like beta-propeller repeat protein [Firmicutes bacterium]|nr:PQQ-binding-like beta-propeller repeat protein [Bacillota bacterium]